MNTAKKQSSASIAYNRKAHHDFTLEDQYEAGLVLQGWEVKSIRAGRANLKESHVIIKQGEAWLLNAHISPLSTVSAFSKADPRRTRKLLLNRRELERLLGAVQRKGYTIAPVSLYWKGPRVKLKIALAKGKKTHDKRSSEKAADWQRQKQRLLRTR